MQSSRFVFFDRSSYAAANYPVSNKFIWSTEYSCLIFLINFVMPAFFSQKFEMNSPLQPRLGMIDILSNKVLVLTFTASWLVTVDKFAAMAEPELRRVKNWLLFMSAEERAILGFIDERLGET